MLAMKVIESAQSDWASTVVFAPKKDGTLGVCIDYRKINAVTVCDPYQPPQMDECVDSLGDAQVCSALGANSGYYQIKVDRSVR